MLLIFYKSLGYNLPDRPIVVLCHSSCLIPLVFLLLPLLFLFDQDQFDWGAKTRFIMTENDKNDLKVPCFDNRNKALSRDTRIKVWTQTVKFLFEICRYRHFGYPLFYLKGNPDNRDIEDHDFDFLDDFKTEFFTDLANETLQEEHGRRFQEPQEASFDFRWEKLNQGPLFGQEILYSV